MSKTRSKQADARGGDGILRVVPLGGLGEVGKNMMIMEYVSGNSHDSIIIDAGIMFPENDMLGIDYIIPDFNYIMDRLDTIRGVIITHGHEDHTGAIAHVMQHVDAPVYGTLLTRGLLEVKLESAGLLDRTELVTIKAGDTIQLGPFQIEFFHVTHSIPDCVGLGITTPVGLVVHTGDYKFDHNPVDGWPPDYAKLAEFSQRGVLALFADSTNATVPGWTPSESEIEPAFDHIFRNAPGRIIVATFASLISRVQQVVNVAERYGRRMVVQGYSMVENIRMAERLGYLKIPDWMPITVSEAKELSPREVFIMTTGTQGEPLAGLGRLSTGQHRNFEIEPGDTVLMSSHPIPGNEEMVYRTINKLIQRGAEVIYDPLASVHVSGHAAQEEMKLMINLVRPKFLVPIHGELRMLHQHAKMGQELGIPRENIAVVENGYVLEFTADSMTIGERVPGGYVYVDGAIVGDVGPAVLREREILGRDGLVIVDVLVDSDTRKIVGEPEIISRGFVFMRDAQPLMNGAQARIEQVISQTDNISTRALGRNLQDALERYFYAETKRRPMVFVFVHAV
ncbi:MAG TPA: ribonuclease J [Aggregatilineales bacterium]|nr:ribonuclease J [Aggregatilineales bacterium]HPV07756.1 ribonuclease J [Aggregatilineales bacterium]HQA67599.1 ribonuclease J [Aggregatilineales bacterium]HQE17128.1 ribonuclease J [Aggregatilineales bacterium]